MGMVSRRKSVQPCTEPLLRTETLSSRAVPLAGDCPRTILRRHPKDLILVGGRHGSGENAVIQSGAAGRHRSPRQPQAAPEGSTISRGEAWIPGEFTDFDRTKTLSSRAVPLVGAAARSSLRRHPKDLISVG